MPHNHLDMVHEIFEGDERQLSFEVGVFAQVAASVTLSQNELTGDSGTYKRRFHLFSALKLSCTQKTSPNEGRHVSRYSCELWVKNAGWP